MIDEKHRHEIAEAMRRCDPKAFGWPIGLAAAISQASDGGQDRLHELADLIDRPTCEMTECSIDHGSRSWGMRCSRCGTEFEHEKPVYGWRYCPKCGAMVVEKEEDDGQ